MREVIAPKSDVLNILRANRDNHQAAYEAALEGWRKETTEELYRQLDRIRRSEANGTDLEGIYVNASPPRNHVSDYDRAIAMLEMHTGDTIVMDEERFSNFVMDDWRWRREFWTSVTAFGKGQFKAPDATVPSFYDHR